MTGVRPDAPVPAPPGLGPNQARALTLLKAGAIGGHLGAAAATGFFVAGRGVTSGLWCLLAAGVTLAFYIVGQAVQVRVADEPPQRVLVAALVSYGVRVSALGGLLAVAITQGERLQTMDRTAVVVGTLAVVVGWLTAEIVAFSRMRVPLYEPPSRKPGTPSAGRG
nr:hypothetical protein [Propionibacterium sp.]